MEDIWNEAKCFERKWVSCVGAFIVQIWVDKTHRLICIALISDNPYADQNKMRETPYENSHV